MSIGYCTNLPSRCAKAASKEPIEANTPSARCPECGASLAFGGKKNSLPQLLLLGVVVLAAILAAVAMLFFQKDDQPAKAAQESSAAVAPAKQQAPITPAQPTKAKPILVLSGSNTIGARIAPSLVEAWLKSIGAADAQILAKPVKSDHPETIVSGTLQGQPIEVLIKAHGSGHAFKDLKNGAADIGMSSRRVKKSEVEELAALGNLTARASEHVLGLDGIAIIVAPGNPLEKLTKTQIRKIFLGEITDWSQAGGKPGRIGLYARDDASGTYDTFKSLVLQDASLAKNTQRFEDSAELERSVAGDPRGIGFVGLPYVKNTKALAVADGDAAPLAPTSFTIRREDYPLSRRLYIYTAAAPSNPRVMEFVNFALSRTGQEVVRGAGALDLDLSAPVDRPKLETARNCRLSGEFTGDPNEYCKLIQSAEALPTNFRFFSGSDELDNRAFRDLRRLLEWMEAHSDKKLVLIGFADSQGDWQTNRRLSERRANRVAEALQTLGIPRGGLEVRGYSEELPVADNTTEEGREKNRRVEVFAR